MTKAQTRILIAAAAAIVLLLLFPPFVMNLQNGISVNMGYAFVLNPPKYNANLTASVNIGMLLLQWIAVAMVAGVSWLTLSRGTQ